MKKPDVEEGPSYGKGTGTPEEDSSSTDDSIVVVSSREPPEPEPIPSKIPCNVRSTTVKLLMAVCILGGVAVILSIAFLGTATPVDFFATKQDPPGVEAAEKWGTDGNNGLDLEILNALEDRWTPYFEEYVQLWGEGTPDSLTLSTRRVQVDPECSPSFGRLKVCNGNYGLQQDWKGINLSLKQDDFIVWSVSKMNDSYLDTSSEDEKKYTMCHEMGHGFGLAHTDENYSNRNRGDCMDYTLRPAGNLVPGQFNHDVLAKLYGTTTRRLLYTELFQDELAQAIDRMEDSQSCDDAHCTEDLGGGFQLVAHKLKVAK
mmetsp:Transcript_25652/g.42680  ORF Transcript_25652/g.42680 Transcript_25652/m.42680 type:complete len:316 (+) Transcript_25652:1655-2602(+)